MELTDDVQKRFNDMNQSIFGKVRLQKSQMFMNGSFPSSPWAGDIDLYTPLRYDDLDKVRELVKSLMNDTDEIVMTRLKVGEHKYSSKKTMNSILMKKKKMMEQVRSAPQGKRWVKLNFLVFTGETVEDVSIVYDLDSNNPLTRAKVRESIKGDIRDYIKKQDYYKALKRMKLLADGKLKQEVETLLNDSRLGQLYLARIRAENIHNSKGILPKDYRDVSMGNLRQAIRVKLSLPSFDVKYKTIPKVVKQLTRILNEETLPFISSLLDRYVQLTGGCCDCDDSKIKGDFTI